LKSINKRVEDLEAMHKGIEKFIVAYQDLEDKTLFRIEGKEYREEELDHLGDQEDVTLLKVTYVDKLKGDNKRCDDELA